MLIAGALLGVVGAILAVPFAAVVKTIVDEAGRPRREQMARLRETSSARLGHFRPSAASACSRSQSAITVSIRSARSRTGRNAPPRPQASSSAVNCAAPLRLAR